MMSVEQFDNTCTGCKPVVIEPATGVAFGEDTPIGKAMESAWETLSLDERQAFHRVCCLHSRDETDLNVCTKLTKQMTAYLQTLEGPT